MDVTILIYYIFWINNIFVFPFFWLWIKIIYYNRTILLLLLFYYLLAKFTIKELGYRYIYFFKLDIRKWRSIYLNYIWDITTYHIEIISIIIFLIVIGLPLFLHHREIAFLVIFSLMLIFLFFKNYQHKLKYIKNKKIKLKELLLIWFLIFLSLKFFNHHYFKDVIMTYMHLDKWAFNLLEWKIQMYDKAMAKDYLYYQTVGLKPKWVGEKINVKDMSDKKKWDLLYKQKKSVFWYDFKKDFKYKFNRTVYKYYLYTKYYQRSSTVKCQQALDAFKDVKKDILLKKKPRINIYAEVKEFTPKVITKKENPVVTQEKSRERALHQKILLNNIFNFSVNNYYKMNYLLKNLTLKTLYNQPFIDKSVYKKEAINEKKISILLTLKEKIKNKEDYKLYINILRKIMKNEASLNADKLDISIIQKNEFYMIDKILEYIKINKNNEKNLKDIFKKFNNTEKKDNMQKKKIKLNMKLLLKKINNDYELNKKTNKYTVLEKSKKKVLENDNFKKKKKKNIYYIKREEEEKTNKILLTNTVKKYNTEKVKINLKSEFNDRFYKKENKMNLSHDSGPDLSRRQRK